MRLILKKSIVLYCLDEFSCLLDLRWTDLYNTTPEWCMPPFSVILELSYKDSDGYRFGAYSQVYTTELFLVGAPDLMNLGCWGSSRWNQES